MCAFGCMCSCLMVQVCSWVGGFWWWDSCVVVVVLLGCWVWLVVAGCFVVFGC